ncbi:Transcriptional regulator, TetR family [Cystobacter fuscus DSM 2262]|uniref:Transcriptional regulator, TetR family n=1 Tax=Cystobacter fuscus (strain ATCC 25194 / DSM 2262 / NBRC 100088 / M29) TaxID=1242864 RepID=S9PK36_CYSF2|nr:TetR/AcrR family transcriptional regulator [Cystobacter fuscus]EPX63421.1 Transcriptional regulator, TetR family [Cystobacter fuscus DSM 2262]
MSQRQSKSVEAGSRENERRHTILRAAIDVFARKGYHGCRIADVAREAGVAYGLVYHYFKNKDELLETVAETGWGGFVSRIRAVAEEENSSLEAKVRGIADVAFEAYRVDPRAVKVLILEIARSPAGGHVASRQQAFLDVIRMAADMFARAQAEGQLRPELDPMLCASLLCGSIEMGLTAFVSGLMEDRSPEALDRAKAQIAESFLRGVLPSSAPLTETSWKQESPSSGTRPKVGKRA